MNETRDEALEPLEGTGSGRSVIQQWGAIIGILTAILGIILALVIFFKVLGYLNEPATFKQTVDEMEVVLLGARDAPREVSIRFNETTRGRAGEPIAGQQPMPPLPLNDITIPTSFARSAAAGLTILLLFILSRIALGIATTGGKLIALANPYKQMYERVRKDFLKKRQPRE